MRGRLPTSTRAARGAASNVEDCHIDVVKVLEFASGQRRRACVDAEQGSSDCPRAEATAHRTAPTQSCI
eukprot:7607371-Pyramimonas_sp.AAC.1